MKTSFVVVDIETTGISPTSNMITEIGALKVVDNVVVDTYNQLINPEAFVSEQITKITGLTNEILKDKPVLSRVFGDFDAFCENLPLLGHNIMFDFSFLKYHGNLLGYPFEKHGIDTYRLATYYVPELKSKSLTSLIEYFDINREIAHRAYHDALATYEIYKVFYKEFMKPGEEVLFEPAVLQWKAQKTSPITPKQVAFLSALIEKHHMYEAIDVKSLTKSEASRYIDRILFEKGHRN
jgi:DNA polymerase III subunit epsilon